MATTSVLYLDVDDEITSAAGRIRSAEARRVAVVLPYGSRVATSRINFRLLARDALTHEKRLSIVAGDAATRALAASAGLPVFSSVGEYESSEEGMGAAAAAAASAGAVAATRPAREPRSDGGSDVASGAAASGALAAAGAAAASTRPPRAARPAADVDTSAVTVEGRTPVGAAALAAAAAPASTAGSTRPVVRPERVRPSIGPGVARTPILVGLAVVALVVVVGAVAAYLLLPSATIAITPREETIGPTSFQITADPDANEPDVEAGVVPATVLDVPVEKTATWPATGKRVEEAAATGRVRFENLDFTATNRIPKGAVVSTESGVRFRTDKTVTVPKADLVGLTVVPATASVDVTAVDEGPEGNVAQNSIRSVPRGENPLFLNVTNPDPTEGGAREEFPRVTQDDVDAATSALLADLQEAFGDGLTDPALGGGDVTVFPDTAILGEPTFSVEDPASLVGQEVTEFELGASATGTVTAVDESPVAAIAESRLTSSVDDGYELVPDSSDIQVSPGSLQGGAIRFPVTVTARQVRLLDPEAIEAEIRGLSLDDARAALEGYGTVDLQVWPDWVSAVPTIDGRVQVTIDRGDGPPVEGPTPSATP